LIGCRLDNWDSILYWGKIYILAAAWGRSRIFDPEAKN
jgi:hypothetical protein